MLHENLFPILEFDSNTTAKIEPSKVIGRKDVPLKKEDLPYIKAKTWTTDAVYRETDEKIALRASEGCLTVEMEAAAFFAVSRFRSVILGQILYGGDDLSGDEWDSRQWKNRGDIRRNLVELCLRIAVQL